MVLALLELWLEEGECGAVIVYWTPSEKLRCSIDRRGKEGLHESF